MMKPLIFSLLLILCIACSETRHTATKSGKLDGTWVPVRQELGGKELLPVMFEKQKMILSGNTYILIAESTDKGEIVFHDNKIDIYGREGVNASRHFTAIYKLKSGQLTVCYNLMGDVYPEGFETAGKPMYFLSVFQKVNFSSSVE